MHRITRLLIGFGAAATLGACASGTQVSSGGEVTSATPATGDWLPVGTTMSARLNNALSTSSNEGDAFTATVTSPVYAQNGAVAVPTGATLYGHVTGVHSTMVPGEQNLIRLDFDELRMNGRQYPFSGSVSNVDVQQKGVSTTRGAVTGAAAGAVLGAVIGGGDLSKIITGGLLGAAAGTVISMGTQGSATIPSGTMMTVKANQSVQIR